MIKDLTINQIRELINLLADTEYQRGYADGLKEKIATKKHWGNPAPPKQTKRECGTCKFEHYSITTMPCMGCGSIYGNYTLWTPKQEDKTE